MKIAITNKVTTTSDNSNNKKKKKKRRITFLARDSIYAIAPYMLSPFRPSVCLSVTRVDQSKTVKVRITQPSPQSIAP